MHLLFGFLLSTISLFLILLVLVQRGRGGGLTGALGGMGGQSAFGTKAGDTFTRVTIVAATVWILSAILAVKLLGGNQGPLGDANAASSELPPAAESTIPPGTTGTSPLDALPTATDGSSDSSDASTPADGTSTPVPGAAESTTEAANPE